VTNYYNILMKFNMCAIMWSFILADFWAWPSCKWSCLPLH